MEYGLKGFFFFDSYCFFGNTEGCLLDCSCVLSTTLSFSHFHGVQRKAF